MADAAQLARLTRTVSDLAEQLAALADELERGTTDPTVTVSVEEAAKRLGVSRGYVYQLVEAGDLPALRFGRRVSIRAVTLEEWMRNWERRPRHANQARKRAG